MATKNMVVSLSTALAATAFMVASASTVQAQDGWPDRPIRFVVHVAAGGGVDLPGRLAPARPAR